MTSRVLSPSPAVEPAHGTRVAPPDRAVAATADVRAHRPGRRILRPGRTLALVLAAVWAAQGAVTVWRLLSTTAGPGGARNLEATYHALLTATALREQPIWQTLGLPIVTLGGANNAGYPWGAAVPNTFGQFTYTSFPPGGFWLAAIATAVPLDPFAALLVLNGVLGAVTGTFIALTVHRAVRGSRFADSAVLAAGLAGLAYVLSAESLQSHGPVYWPQSALQPVLAAQLLLLLVIIDDGASRRRLLGLAALTAAGGYIEWTEYVFAFGVAALIVVVPNLRRRMGAASVVLAVTGALTAVVLFLHFTRRLGVPASIAAWTSRAEGRSQAPLLGLLDGLALSLGGTALALLLIALAGLLVGTRGTVPRRWLVVLAFATVPCIENLLLRQHATQFTFDRLKDVVPLALAVGLAVALLARRRVLIAAVALACATVLSFGLQLRDEQTYAGWHDIDVTNRAMLAKADAIVPFDCARFGTSGIVRGYLSTATGRSIQEWIDADMLDAAAKGDGSCGTVFLQTTAPFLDLQQIDWITLRSADGKVTVVERPKP